MMGFHSGRHNFDQRLKRRQTQLNVPSGISCQSLDRLLRQMDATGSSESKRHSIEDLALRH